MPTEAYNSPHSNETGGPAFRRRVFYLSGFDPRGPRWYHRLFTREARKYPRQSDFSILAITGATQESIAFTWRIEAMESDRRVETLYSVLDWQDVIRNAWPRGRWTMLKTFASNFVSYLSNGTLLRLAKTAKPTFICAIFPTLFVMSLLLGALIAGVLGGRLISILLPDGSAWATGAVWATGIIVTIGLVATGLTLIDRRFKIFWLNRIYLFNRMQAQRAVPGLDERIERFAEVLAKEWAQSKEDEILLVAHSTGCQVAVSVLAGALRRSEVHAVPLRKLSFLTLGSNLTMLSWQPAATWFREDLSSVAASHPIEWIDFSMPSDGACYPLYDPVAGAGLDNANGLLTSPKLLNARVFKLHSAQRLEQIRKDKLLLHFQYIMAPEIVGEYDFFRIVAGDMKLGDRYRHRSSVADYTNPMLR